MRTSTSLAHYASWKPLVAFQHHRVSQWSHVVYAVSTKIMCKDSTLADDNLLDAALLPAKSEHHSMLSECSNVGLIVTESSDPRNHFVQPPLLTFISTWVSLAYVAKSTSLPVFRP